jgi:hypothetical protein
MSVPDAMQTLEGSGLSDGLEGLEVLHFLGDLHCTGPFGYKKYVNFFHILNFR